MELEYYPSNRIQEETAVYEPDFDVPYEEEGWGHEEYEEYDDPSPLYEQPVYEEEVRQSGVRPQWMIAPVVLLTIVILTMLSVANSGTGGKVAVGQTAVSTENTASTGGASSSFIAPYDSYVLTQGLHGYSYGHMAIDIAAGVGATIKAPITGKITELYTDAYNNPTLVIENERYKVMFLHGNYTAVLGQNFKQGDPIGTEGNNGYTMDSAGNLCYGRAGCGYHTHLNVFDKQLGQNVNPLELINN